MSQDGHSYRLTADGPVHLVYLPAPGVIAVRITWDRGLEPLRGHVHRHEHASRVVQGAVVVSFDGAARCLLQGEMIDVPAGVRHALMPTEPGTVVECEHRIRAENGDLMPDAFDPDGIPLEWVTRLTVAA